MANPFGLSSDTNYLLKDEKEISTVSVGEEPNRHIVIKFIEKKED